MSDIKEEQKILADMISDALVDAGLISEMQLDRATEIILEEITVRHAIELNRDTRRK